MVDYSLHYPEVQTYLGYVGNSYHAISAWHGIPQVVRNDNGSQFFSYDFAKFANSYELQHVMSIPHYPKNNGLVKRMVQTVNRMI